MYTISGRNIEIGGEVPTVKDVATGLARIPRWAGATLRRWSVAQHSLMIERIARQFVSNIEETDVWASDLLRLIALWHDAHEFATGDIPFPFKTQEQRDLQEQIQEWLLKEVLGLSQLYKQIEHRPYVKKLDQKCVVAEAHTLCHPRVAAEFLSPENGFGTDLSIDDYAIEVLMDLIEVPEHEVISMFCQQTEELLVTRGVRYY